MTTAVARFAPRKRFVVPWAEVAIAVAVFLGVSIACVAALVGLGRIEALGPLVVTPSRACDLLALAFLVGVGPYAAVSSGRRSKLLTLDARLPDFLNDLASLHKAGLTLQESLLTAAQGDYGPLNPYIREAADQVRWNIPILTALQNLQDRIGTPIAKRTLAVILEAGRTGGNVPEVIGIAAENSRAFINLREQRRRAMGLYTIITYVASVIFIAVCLALQGVFVPRMIEAFAKVAGGGGGLGLSTLPSADAFRGLFFTAALVQAVGNGLIAGIMSDGKVVAGLRHSWTMVALALLGFVWF